MSIGEKLISIARLEIGYTESPANSNKTKYGKWFGLDGLAWCGIFVSWVYAQCGVSLGKIGFTKGFAGCQTAILHFKETGEVTKDPKPGDIVFFDWNEDGRWDHTGIFVRRISDTQFETIEGNTSSSNQSNGGIVMLRVRNFRTRTMFVHPKVLDPIV